MWSGDVDFLKIFIKNILQVTNIFSSVILYYGKFSYVRVTKSSDNLKSSPKAGYCKV